MSLEKYLLVGTMLFGPPKQVDTAGCNATTMEEFFEAVDKIDCCGNNQSTSSDLVMYRSSNQYGGARDSRGSQAEE